MQKLSRKKENRERLFRNLVTSLILHESITTTVPKAKSIKPTIVKLLKLAKKNDLTARRESKKILFTNKSVKKLFEDIQGRLQSNQSENNIKFYRLENRLGDNASQVKIKLNLKPLEEVIQSEDRTEKKSQIKSTQKDG